MMIVLSIIAEKEEQFPVPTRTRISKKRQVVGARAAGTEDIGDARTIVRCGNCAGWPRKSVFNAHLGDQFQLGQLLVFVFVVDLARSLSRA